MSVDTTRLRLLEQAATKGPWNWVGGDTMRAGPLAITRGDGDVVFAVDLPEFIEQPDADLIAAMRNDLPALLDAAERLARVRREIEPLAAVGAGTLKQTVPLGCSYRPHVSRVCQRGTGGCQEDHAAPARWTAAVAPVGQPEPPLTGASTNGPVYRHTSGPSNVPAPDLADRLAAEEGK